MALDLQRELLDTGCLTVETGVSLQQQVNTALVDSVESWRELDLRILTQQYSLLWRTVRQTDDPRPGSLRGRAEDLTAGSPLQTDREETVDSLVTALEAAGDTTEENTLNSFDTLEEQLLALSVSLEQGDRADTNVESLGPVTDREN